LEEQLQLHGTALFFIFFCEQSYSSNRNLIMDYEWLLSLGFRNTHDSGNLCPTFSAQLNKIES
jgi:hypothetical protein